MSDEEAVGGEPALEEMQKRKKSGSQKAQKNFEKLSNKYKKRGIVYLSRLPPHMKPQKLRHMLEQHAPLGRLYLAPEDPLVRKKRKQHGGNSGKNFTEGWVEFEDKADAKRIAGLLNGQPMGGKRRSAHFYDLWTLKYLPKFKWDHLTEEINYQKAVREQRLAAEVAAAKRERDFYLSRVDRAKAEAAMTERREKKRQQGEEGGTAEGGKESSGKAGGGSGAAENGGRKRQQRQQREQHEGGPGEDEKPRVMRTYGQRRAKADPVTDADAPQLSRGLLEMIAGKGKGRAAA